MGRIGRSIELLKQSWAILKKDRELMWLPVISVAVSVIIAAIVLVPIALTQDWDAISSDPDNASSQIGTGTYIALAALGLVLSFVSIFFRGAIVAGAHERMVGGDPTVGSSIGGALSRISKLLSWAVITTIVGSILRAIEERSGLIGRIVIGFVGMAWAVTTFLVIPVVIIENTGAVASIQRSVDLFRRTWGENLAAQIGLSLIGFLAFIPLGILAGLGAYIGTLLGFVLIALAVVGGIVLATALSTLGGVFQTALYHYAVGSELTDGIDTTVMRNAFAPKR